MMDVTHSEVTLFKTIDPPEPLHQNQRLRWDHPVNLIGEKVVDPLIHCCDDCNLPILLYGRMIPCKHVFCLNCAKKSDKKCPRCNEGVQRIDQSALGTVFVCTYGSSKHCKTACRRTYLSVRDLQAHIDHRHLKVIPEASKSAQYTAPSTQYTVTSTPIDPRTAVSHTTDATFQATGPDVMRLTMESSHSLISRVPPSQPMAHQPQTPLAHQQPHPMALQPQQSMILQPLQPMAHQTPQPMTHQPQQPSLNYLSGQMMTSHMTQQSMAVTSQNMRPNQTPMLPSQSMVPIPQPMVAAPQSMVPSLQSIVPTPQSIVPTPQSMATSSMLSTQPPIMPPLHHQTQAFSNSPVHQLSKVPPQSSVPQSQSPVAGRTNLITVQIKDEQLQHPNATNSYPPPTFPGLVGPAQQRYPTFSGGQGLPPVMYQPPSSAQSHHVPHAHPQAMRQPANVPPSHYQVPVPAPSRYPSPQHLYDDQCNTPPYQSGQTGGTMPQWPPRGPPPNTGGPRVHTSSQRGQHMNTGTPRGPPSNSGGQRGHASSQRGPHPNSGTTRGPPRPPFY